MGEVLKHNISILRTIISVKKRKRKKERKKKNPELPKIYIYIYIEGCLSYIGYVCLVSAVYNSSLQLQKLDNFVVVLWLCNVL